MGFVFAIYGLFVYMVYWAEEHSDSCQASKMELFAKLVKNWKLSTFFAKNSTLDVWQGSEYISAEWKVNCLARFCYILQFEITFIFYHFCTIRRPLETLSVLGFFIAQCTVLNRYFMWDEHSENLTSVSSRY